MARLQEKPYENELYVCARCGYCREVCPVKKLNGFDKVCPRGKILLLKHFMEKKMPITKDMIWNWYYCCTCGYCAETCPVNIDFPTVVKDVRVDLVKRGLNPLEPFKIASANILTEGNPFGKPKSERTEWIPQSVKLSKKSDTLYWAGCTSAYWTTETAGAVVSILHRINFDYNMLGGDEGCCGMIPVWGGGTDVSRQIAERNVRLIEDSGAKVLFTTCPGCYSTFKEDYPKLVGKLGFEVRHASELFSELIKSGRLKFTHKVASTVTYHDPCHIGRFHGIFEEPREIISAIPGVKFIEMDYNRRAANCCGGPMRTAFAEDSLTVAQWRVDEALSTKAEILTTFCPQCTINLRQGAATREATIEVLDLPELMLKAI